MRRLATFVMMPALAVLVSCATEAPSLPDDTTGSNRKHSLSIADFKSDDTAMDCAAVKAEQSSNAAKIDADNQAVVSNRQRNEIAGYLGGMLILPYVATEQNDAERTDIANLQQRQDILRNLAAVKNCSV